MSIVLPAGADEATDATGVLADAGLGTKATQDTGTFTIAYADNTIVSAAPSYHLVPQRLSCFQRVLNPLLCLFLSTKRLECFALEIERFAWQAPRPRPTWPQPSVAVSAL